MFPEGDGIQFCDEVVVPCVVTGGVGPPIGADGEAGGSGVTPTGEVGAGFVAIEVAETA